MIGPAQTPGLARRKTNIAGLLVLELVSLGLLTTLLYPDAGCPCSLQRRSQTLVETGSMTGCRATAMLCVMISPRAAYISLKIWQRISVHNNKEIHLTRLCLGKLDSAAEQALLEHWY